MNRLVSTARLAFELAAGVVIVVGVAWITGHIVALMLATWVSAYKWAAGGS
jgi:hypothetical protein